MNLIIGTYTLPILREGFSWNENCGENGSHATSSVSLSVRPVDGFLTYLMTAEGNLSAVIKDGSTVLFSGVVRPYTGTSFEGNYQENISLEIMDYTEAMHIYIYPETTDGQKTGCIYPTVYQNKSLSEMVGILFGLGGKSISSSFTSTESIPYFKLEGEQYLDDVISELLFEYGYDYKWNAEGKAVIFPTFVDSVTVGTISDVRGNFSISRSDDTTDGLKVTWREYEYQTNVPLYSFDSGNQTFNEGWEYEIGSLKQLTGKLYSGAMHDSHFNSGATMPSGNLWTWNFPDLSRSGRLWELLGKAKTDKAENTDSVLFVETDSSKISVSLYDEDGVTLSTTLESYDVNGMRMYVDYSGIFNVAFGTGWTWKVNVRGNIGTAVKSEASYNIIGANPDTKELKYRLGLKGSSVISENLVKQLYLRSKFSKISYSFSSLTSYELGGFYILEGNTIRIVSKVKDEEGIYTYRGEGAKAYSGVSLNVFSEQKGNNRSSSAKSAYDIAVDNGYTGSEEEWLASLDGVSTALLYLYKRSAAQPESFDGGTVTYTFSTGVMSGSFGTWSSSIPTGTDALYFVLVRATGKGETYTVTSGMWSTPALMSESGSKGADGKTAVIVNIYQRATSSPATPSSVVTYSFADFTATGLGNWSLAIPAGTNPLWVSQACAISTKESDVIESKEWATPRKVMENGESPVQIGLSSDSWIFPADCDGLVSVEEYAKLKIDVTAVKGSTTLIPALSVELTGITNVSVSGSSVVGSSDSIMVGDSASVKVFVVVEGKTYTKTVSIAKAKQSKSATLYFAWSKSESIFTPKDSNFWIMGTSFIFFNNSLMGNIPFTSSWVDNWEEIQSAKTDEYCYLWCKTSEDGTPFLFTGATGKTGEYRKVMYALSDSKTTAPTDGWTETMPDIVNSTQYLWYKEKIVPAGGNADEVEWSDEVVSAVGIAVTESKISLSADGSNLVVGKNVVLLDAPNIIVPNTITANEVDASILQGKQFILKNNGSIQSEGYSDISKKGFKLDSDGSAVLKDITVQKATITDGTFSADGLRTSNEDKQGAWCSIAGYPNESGVSSSSIQIKGDDGSLVSVGTLQITRTPTGYVNMKEFAQWCLDNIPIDKTQFTKLEGTINGYHAYAKRTSQGVYRNLQKTGTIMGDLGASRQTVAEITVSCGKCYKYLGIDGSLSAELEESWWVTIDGTEVVTKKKDTLSYYMDELGPGDHTIKVELGYPWPKEKAYTLDICTSFAPYGGNFNSNNIELRLYSGDDDSIVFEGGTSDNKLMVVEIGPNYALTNRAFLLEIDNTDTYANYYKSMPINLSYGGASFIGGDGLTGWTATRYEPFLGLWKVGEYNETAEEVEWLSTPVERGDCAYKISSVVIDGVLYDKDFTVSYSGGVFAIYSDDGKVNIQYQKNNYYTAFSVISFVEIGESKGAYVASLYPMEAGVSDVGSINQKFDQVWANEIHGKHVGEVEGDISGNVTGDVTGNVTGNLTGNVNGKDTANSVYGCKFQQEPLFAGTVSAGTTYTLRGSISDYQWISVFVTNSNGSTGSMGTTFFKPWLGFTSDTTRLILASDAHYLSFYFKSATSIYVVDKSSPTMSLHMYGYK